MYQATDLYFVAALIAYGANYHGVDRSNKRNQLFIFDDPFDVKEIFIKKDNEVDRLSDPTFDEIKHAFDTVILMFPPNYTEAVRRIKGIINS